MRIIRAILFVLIFLTAAVGCKPTTSSAIEATPHTQDAINLTPSPTIPADPTAHPDLLVEINDLEENEVIFWHSFTGEMRTVIRAQVNDFNQTNEWGIFVEIQDFSSFDLMREALADTEDISGYPNVITAPHDFLIGQSASSPAVIALDHYADSLIFGISDTRDYYDAVWMGDVDGGERYGLPAYRSAQVMFYNLDLARELGFDAFPATIEEWKNQSCTAALSNSSDSDKTNDGTGGWIVDLESATWLNWINALREDSAVVGPNFLFSTAQNESSFQFIRALFDDGCAWFPREQKPHEYLRDGYALFYSGRLERVLIQEHYSGEGFSSADWEVSPFPGVDGASVLILHGYSYGILESDPAGQLASWLFIRWLQDPLKLADVVKASASLPLKKSTASLLAGYGEQHPQWQAIVGHMEMAQPAPTSADWQIIQLVLQDVAWQSLQANVTSADIPNLLRQADDTVADIKAQLVSP